MGMQHTEALYPQPADAELAVLSMGCFWKSEAELGGLPGVLATDVGYVADVEAARCRFDPAVTQFSHILDIFERSLQTPVGKNQKYSQTIYPRNEEQYAAAIARVGPQYVAQFRGFRRARPQDQKYHLTHTKAGKRFKDQLKGRANSMLLTKANHCAAKSIKFDEQLYGAVHRLVDGS